MRTEEILIEEFYRLSEQERLILQADKEEEERKIWQEYEETVIQVAKTQSNERGRTKEETPVIIGGKVSTGTSEVTDGGSPSVSSGEHIFRKQD